MRNFLLISVIAFFCCLGINSLPAKALSGYVICGENTNPIMSVLGGSVKATICKSNAAILQYKVSGGSAKVDDKTVAPGEYKITREKFSLKID